MRSRSVFSAAAVLCGSLVMFPAVAGAVPSAATTWTGWDAPGPLGVSVPAHVAAGGSTTAVLGSSIEGGSIATAVTSAAGSRIGRVAVNVTDPARLAVALAGPDQLLLADGCRIRRSTDRGLTWAGDPLAGCNGQTPDLTVLDAHVAFASIPTRTWRSLDGGATWAAVNAAERGPLVALDANTGLKVVSAGPAAFALQRTTDGGASWQGLKVPGPVSPADPVPPPTGTTPVPPTTTTGTTPAPPTETTPTTPAPPVAPELDSLPVIAGLARRADGAVLVGAGSTLLVSTDHGTSFVRHDVPVPDDLPGAGSVTIDAVVCDPAGGCVVGVHAATDAKRRSALRFDANAFGARVAALPPTEAQAPAAGTVVGMEAAGSQDARAVLTGDFGATPYRPIASGRDRPGSIGVHGLLAIPSVGRLHVSTDHGASWSDVPLPETPAFTSVASAGGKLLALADDGTLRRFADGAWAKLADLSTIKPRAIAVSGDTPIVVGDRGVVRLADPAKTDPVSAPALQGRGFGDVVAAGRTVIAWAGRVAVRSTDGGQHWSRTTLPAGAGDVQLVTAKVGYALAGGTLFRTTDGGKRFSRRAVVPNLGSGGPRDDERSARGIEFSSAKGGVLLTGSGGFVTLDGGKSLAVLPTPGASTPAAASLFGGGGVVVQDPVLGAVFRSTKLISGSAPSLRLRAVGRAKRHGASRTITIVGVLGKAIADQPVSIVAVRGAGQATKVEKVVTPNADGSFRASITLARNERGVQAWYRGAVRPDRTARGASSAVLKVR